MAYDGENAPADLRRLSTQLRLHAADLLALHESILKDLYRPTWTGGTAPRNKALISTYVKYLPQVAELLQTASADIEEQVARKPVDRERTEGEQDPVLAARGSAEAWSVIVDLGDMIASGLVGAYAVAARDRIFRALRRKHSAAYPRAEAVVAAARWAVNKRYGDILSPTDEPTSERFNANDWEVIFEHGDHRYYATGKALEEDVRKTRIAVQRTATR